MPHDPVRVADTQAWLKKAELDLRAAAHDQHATPPLLEDSLFHCQQAAEKALKALLTWHDQPFRKTHDLTELGQQAIQLDATLDPLCRRAATLTTFAWVFRYPGGQESPTVAEAQEGLALAQEIVQAVRSRLPTVCHPKA